ncbi:MAG: regulatory protein GemA, partial [Proteobacteria bacterium]|nr:regulatory protein GemA [Pseudomonadota bacterium]
MAAKPKSTRNSELAAIHCAKKDLGLDDETYRDMLFTIARVRSAGDLDWTGRKRVMEHLKSRGAGKGRKPNEWAFIDRATADRQPLLRKICAVCRAMKVGKKYAEGVAKRQHHIERRLEMMDANELWLLAGALSRT